MGKRKRRGYSEDDNGGGGVHSTIATLGTLGGVAAATYGGYQALMNPEETQKNFEKHYKDNWPLKNFFRSGLTYIGGEPSNAAVNAATSGHVVPSPNKNPKDVSALTSSPASSHAPSPASSRASSHAPSPAVLKPQLLEAIQHFSKELFNKVENPGTSEDKEVENALVHALNSVKVDLQNQLKQLHQRVEQQNNEKVSREEQQNNEIQTKTEELERLRKAERELHEQLQQTVSASDHKITHLQKDARISAIQAQKDAAAEAARAASIQLQITETQKRAVEADLEHLRNAHVALILQAQSGVSASDHKNTHLQKDALISAIQAQKDAAAEAAHAASIQLQLTQVELAKALEEIKSVQTRDENQRVEIQNAERLLKQYKEQAAAQQRLFREVKTVQNIKSIKSIKSIECELREADFAPEPKRSKISHGSSSSNILAQPGAAPTQSSA